MEVIRTSAGALLHFGCGAEKDSSTGGCRMCVIFHLKKELEVLLLLSFCET